MCYSHKYTVQRYTNVGYDKYLSDAIVVYVVDVTPDTHSSTAV